MYILSNEQFKSEIKKKISAKIVSGITNLRINLTKVLQVLCTENYKTLREKKDLNNGEISKYMVRKIQY
jgi:hypothetical protein